MYIRQYPSWSWGGLSWFNLSAPMWIVFPIGLPICLWSLFNRRGADGSHYWGLGLLQIGHRHLFAVMFSGVSIAFIGRIP